MALKKHHCFRRETIVESQEAGVQGGKRRRKLTVLTLLVNGLSTSVIEESSQKTNTKILRWH